MGFGIYDSERRYRRRGVWRVVKFLLFAVLVGGTGLFAYQLAIEGARTSEQREARKLSELSETEAKLRRTIAGLEDELQQERSKARGLEEKLVREMPSGEAKALIELLAERIKNGIDVKRLAFVIGTVQNQRNCQEPQTKRFFVQTPLQRGVASTVTFANETIAISGSGVASRGPSGAEAWFDPGQPITVRISGLGIQPVDFGGILPLSHVVVFKDAEYRFVITPAQQRGFVQASAERCSYP